MSFIEWKSTLSRNFVTHGPFSFAGSIMRWTGLSLRLWRRGGGGRGEEQRFGFSRALVRYGHVKIHDLTSGIVGMASENDVVLACIAM
jgi:hypothetical protein